MILSLLLARNNLKLYLRLENAIGLEHMRGIKLEPRFSGSGLLILHKVLVLRSLLPESAQVLLEQTTFKVACLQNVDNTFDCDPFCVFLV